MVAKCRQLLDNLIVLYHCGTLTRHAIEHHCIVWHEGEVTVETRYDKRLWFS